MFREGKVDLGKEFGMHVRVGIVDGVEVKEGFSWPFFDQAYRHVQDLSSPLTKSAITLSFIAHEQKSNMLATPHD